MAYVCDLGNGGVARISWDNDEFPEYELEIFQDGTFIFISGTEALETLQKGLYKVLNRKDYNPNGQINGIRRLRD